MMKKNVLLISGSPRAGNTEYIIAQLAKKIVYHCDIVLLRNENIRHCCGCLYCHTISDCSLKNDDMQKLREKVLQADLVVIGSPNYFDNISGLLKTFIDRLHPFYKEQKLKGKKLIQFMVGGGGIQGTQKFLDISLYGLTRHLYFDLLGSYSFQALHHNDLKDKKDQEHIINEMVAKINV